MSRPRPARTTIRHGMPSCAAYGCERPECVDALRRNDRRLYRDRAHGITGLVNAGPATRRVQQLLRAGMSIRDIADRSGISASAIRVLANGRRHTITRTTHDAILGTPLPAPGHRSAHNGFVDATGARQRLQALAAVGFGLPYISRRLHVSTQGLGLVRRGQRDRIRVHAHQAIRALYDELWDQDPHRYGLAPETIAALQLHASRQGWKRPADLDDDAIDWRQGAAA